MRVALIDIDFNEGLLQAPNPWMMKISGYYKQRGSSVSLLKEVKRVREFDLVVVSRESFTTKMPPLDILTNSKTKVIGAAMVRQKNYWDLPIQIYQARPDYHLYEFEFPSEYTQASFINNTYKGKIIEVQKQDRVEMERAVNFVIDKDLWSSEDLGEVLDRLAAFGKIIFYEEVDIKKLLNDDLIEKFVKLRLFKGSIRLKKVYSLYDLEQTLKVIKKIKRSKEINFGVLTVITMKENLSKEEALERFFECIKIAALANKTRQKVRFLVPREEVFDYASIFIPFLDYKNEKNSFFAHLLMKEFYSPIRNLLGNRFAWENPVVNSIWRINFKNKEVFEEGFITWGGHPDQIRKIIDEGDAKEFYDTYIF